MGFDRVWLFFAIFVYFGVTVRTLTSQAIFFLFVMFVVGCANGQQSAGDVPTLASGSAVRATLVNRATPIALNRPTESISDTATATRTHTPTETMAHAPTVTHTNTPTSTHTPSATSTKTATASATHTPKPTASATHTPKPTASATHTPTATASGTHTATATASATRTAEPTATASATLVPLPLEPDEIVAFVNVSVVPMDEERVLKGQTVLVYDDRIAKVGAVGEVAVPAEAQVVDGEGKYLMPGLADMHVHLSDEAFLLLFVANGITTVRNMSGTPQHLAWREEIRAGDRLGPTIYTTGPIVDGYPFYWPVRPKIETPAEAERMVLEQKQMGYDFIKVYDDLTISAYNGILMAAQKHNMPVMGHAPKFVDMRYLLTAGQISVEHLLGYVEAQEADVPELIALTSEVGVWNCPTLVVFQPIVPLEGAEEGRIRLETSYMPPSTLTRWAISEKYDANNLSYGPVDTERLELTRALHEAGAPLLLGTDTATPFVVPGFAIHQELRNLVNAGLTPYEAIKAGTRNPADFLNAQQEFGTVSVGKRADLILLQANPLDDVANLSKRTGVMLRGEWLPEETLQQMLDNP